MYIPSWNDIAQQDLHKYRYSPFSLDIESEQIGLLKTARELGVAIVAYSPIGRGMLGGQIRSPDDFEEGDFRKFAPRFSAENFPKNLKLVDRITEIAKAKNSTASQLTLAPHSRHYFDSQDRRERGLAEDQAEQGRRGGDQEGVSGSRAGGQQVP
jgi:hypothetical protein